MDLGTTEAVERAAKALDAASEAMADLGDKPQLADMLAMWLMEEAAALRSILGGPTP